MGEIGANFSLHNLSLLFTSFLKFWNNFTGVRNYGKYLTRKMFTGKAYLTAVTTTLFCFRILVSFQFLYKIIICKLLYENKNYQYASNRYGSRSSKEKKKLYYFTLHKWTKSISLHYILTITNYLHSSQANLHFYCEHI